MTAPTADQIRNRLILVALSDSPDVQLQCRRPDLLRLIADNVLPLDTFGAVLEHLSQIVEANVLFDNRPLVESVVSTPEVYNDFVDRWVCAAVVAPRVVLTEDEALADPQALWVADIPRPTRYEVVRVTNRAVGSSRVRTAVADFRRQQSVGAAPGSDGQAVREDAVAAPPGA